jgi:antitoxin component of MazEF toxin-antitoxin module
VRLPSALLDQLNTKQSDQLVVEAQPDGIVLKQKRRTYLLADLLARCDPDSRMPQVIGTWSDSAGQ